MTESQGPNRAILPGTERRVAGTGHEPTQSTKSTSSTNPEARGSPPKPFIPRGARSPEFPCTAMGRSAKLHQVVVGQCPTGDVRVASQTAPRAAIAENLEALLQKLPDTPEGRGLVRRAYDVAHEFHHDQARLSGEPYIEHPLAVAHLLTELNMDSASVAAGILHDVLEDTDLTYEDLKNLFPDPVPDLVQAVTKIGRIHFDTSREHQIENLRKIILAMAQDIRVIIIKLCDRLHNMRTLKPLAPERRTQIARESLDIYAPLANRLGLARVKSELEDLAMYWLYPAEYKALTRELSKKKRERDQLIQNSIDFLRNHLAGLGYTDIEITGRSKHFYSIWRKMKETGAGFDEIYDLHALRIICASNAQCYEIFGHIHALWPPKMGRIKDYIGFPKPNMYQSLHTTVVGYEGMVTEIQIRTAEMHEVAEFGIAAHWKYKEGRIDQTEDKRLQWLRQLTEWITDIGDPNSMLDQLKKDVFADVVLCFTPRGDVIELPAGATPIDFAYAIHTKVGERCIGAKVNRRMVSLRTTLTHGDMVEILTHPSGHPSRDWLDIVVTGRARSKIKHWLKSKEMEKWVSDGRSALMKLLKERNIDVTKSELDKNLEHLLGPFKMQTIEDVLAEIGFGSISPQAALTRMNPEWSKARRQPRKRARTGRSREQIISVDGMGDDALGMTIRLANCCNPIPGDEIFGFVTRGRGITVHHAQCPSIVRIRMNEEERARLLPARWNVEGPISHTVGLRVEATDRAGLLNDLTQELARQSIFILACHTKSDKKRGTAVIRFEADVSDILQLDNVLKALRHVPGVLRAERTSRAAAV